MKSTTKIKLKTFRLFYSYVRVSNLNLNETYNKNKTLKIKIVQVSYSGLQSKFE